MLIVKAEKKVFTWVLCLSAAVMMSACLLYMSLNSLMTDKATHGVLFGLLTAVLFVIIVLVSLQIVHETKRVCELCGETPESALKYIEHGCVELTNIVYRKLRHDQAWARIYTPEEYIWIEDLKITLLETSEALGGHTFVKTVLLRHEPSGEVYEIDFTGERCCPAYWNDVLIGNVDENFLKLIWALADNPSNYWSIAGDLMRKKECRFIGREK